MPKTILVLEKVLNITLRYKSESEQYRNRLLNQVERGDKSEREQDENEEGGPKTLEGRIKIIITGWSVKSGEGVLF